MVDGNFAALIISGFPSEQDLRLAWEKIQEQYSEKVGSFEYRLYVNLYKEIHILSATIDTIQILIAQLRAVYVKKWADKLNSALFTNYSFDVINSDEYDKTLDICHNKTGGLRLNLDLKLINFKAIEEKNKSADGKASRGYFQSILITLSDNVGYYLTDNITVFEFCDRIVRSQKQSAKKFKHGR